MSTHSKEFTNNINTVLTVEVYDFKLKGTNLHKLTAVRYTVNRPFFFITYKFRINFNENAISWVRETSEIHNNLPPSRYFEYNIISYPT